jgi:hypothetical protein
MATTTPNFGWAVPTSTDLVKDGAVAIETLGDSIDASLVDLKGGTTGQVLAKATGTDMDFTWTTVSSGSTYVSGKNATINGAMDIWQRGTSISLAANTTSANGFTTDRWFMPTGTNQASTISRQAVNDSTNLPSIQYCARVQRNSGQTGTAQMAFNYNFETANSIPFAGKTITVSFYARAGANYSPTSSVFISQLYTGTGTDQNIQVGGFTGQNLAVNQSNTLTTTWQRFSYTYAVPSTVTQFAYIFLWTPTGTAGANDYFEITGVQLEASSTATQFSRTSTTIQGELAACQRYYVRPQLPTAYSIYSCGSARSTTQIDWALSLPVSMRIAPTAVDYSNVQGSLPGFAGYALSALVINHANTTYVGLLGTTTGITQYRPYFLENNGTSGYVGLSAEL